MKLSSVKDIAPYTIIAMNFDATSSDQEDFAREHYMYGSQPKMWVESIDNNIYILMANDYAQSFVDNPHGDERNSVIHEFIHAQHPFVMGDLSRAAEERRAELFSGDLSSYYDAKQFFIYAQVLSGVDLLNMLERHADNPDSFYLELYTTFGIEAGNQFITSLPSNFTYDPSEPVEATIKLTGGMDGFMVAMADYGKKDQAALDARIKQRVEKLRTVFPTKDRILEDLTVNLGSAYKMPSAAAIIADYVQ